MFRSLSKKEKESNRKYDYGSQSLIYFLQSGNLRETQGAGQTVPKSAQKTTQRRH